MPFLRALTLFLIALAGANASIVGITLTGTSGEVSHGHAIGPYFATIDAIPTVVVCDDYLHSITLGQSWQANAVHFADLPASEQPSYQAAFWLVTLILDNPPPHADAQWALWHLFAPQAPLYGGAGAALAWAWSQPGLPGGTFTIYQPLNQGWCGPQEFIGRDAPEPATLFGVGVGLLALSIVRRRRRTR